MATYQRKTDPSIFQPYIYQQPLELMAQNLALKEAKYDQGVEMVSRNYANALNLDVGLKESEDFINSKYQELKPEIEKMSTTDFSIAENVTKATNLLNPIIKNQNIVKDISLNKWYKQQYGKYNNFLQSTDPDTKSMANAYNLEHMQRSYNAYKTGGWENLDKNLGAKRSYVPYHNVGKELIENAKKLNLNVSVQKQGGAYNITEENGEKLAPHLKSLLMTTISGQAKTQLGIEAEVLYDRELDNQIRNISPEGLVNGDISNLAQLQLGKNSVKTGLNMVNVQLSKYQPISSSTQAKITELEKKGLENLTPEEKASYLENKQYLEGITPLITQLTETRENLNNLTDEDIMLKFGKQAYINNYTDTFITGIANAYADGKRKVLFKPDEIVMQQRKFDFEQNQQTRSFNQQNLRDRTQFGYASALSAQGHSQDLEELSVKNQYNLKLAQAKGDISLDNDGNPIPKSTATGGQFVGDTEQNPVVNPTTVTEFNNAVNKVNGDINSNLVSNMDVLVSASAEISDTGKKIPIGDYILNKAWSGDNKISMTEQLKLKKGLEEKEKQEYLFKTAQNLQRNNIIPQNVNLGNLTLKNLALHVQDGLHRESLKILREGKSNLNVTPQNLQNIRATQAAINRGYEQRNILKEERGQLLENIGKVVNTKEFNLLKSINPKYLETEADYNGTIVRAVLDNKLDIRGNDKTMRVSFDRNRGLFTLRSGNYLSTTTYSVNDIKDKFKLPMYTDLRAPVDQNLKYTGYNSILSSGSIRYTDPKFVANTYNQYASVYNAQGGFTEPVINDLLSDTKVLKSVSIGNTVNGMQTHTYEINVPEAFDTYKKLYGGKETSMAQLEKAGFKRTSNGRLSYSIKVPATNMSTEIQHTMANGRALGVKGDVFQAKMSGQPGTPNVTIDRSMRMLKSNTNGIVINSDGSPVFDSNWTNLRSEDVNTDLDGRYNNLYTEQTNSSNLYSSLHSKEARELILNAVKKYNLKPNSDGTYVLPTNLFLSMFGSAKMFIK